MEKKKEKNNKKEEPKKKKKAKRTTKKTINEKVRDVIRGKHALTINQVLQFLSGVIDGDVKDDLTKLGASMQDKISAAKIMLDEYRKQDEAIKKSQEKNGTDKQLEERITKENENLIEALSKREIKGVDDANETIEDLEKKESDSNAI